MKLISLQKRGRNIGPPSFSEQEFPAPKHTWKSARCRTPLKPWPCSGKSRRVFKWVRGTGLGDTAGGQGLRRVKRTGTPAIGGIPENQQLAGFAASNFYFSFCSGFIFGRRARLALFGRLFLCVFRIAPGILYLPLSLFHRSVDLFLRVSGPFSHLTFNAARNILGLTFHLIFVHDYFLRN